MQQQLQEQIPMEMQTTARPAVQQGPTFEQSLARLERIVQMLEKGDAPLDGALQLFEEGTALVRTCSKRLDEAEQKITILMKGNDGSVREQPFEADAQQ